MIRERDRERNRRYETRVRSEIKRKKRGRFRCFVRLGLAGISSSWRASRLGRNQPAHVRHAQRRITREEEAEEKKRERLKGNKFAGAGGKQRKRAKVKKSKVEVRFGAVGMRGVARYGGRTIGALAGVWPLFAWGKGARKAEARAGIIETPPELQPKRPKEGATAAC